MYAAEKMKNVHIGDVLNSINHDSALVKSVLLERWPSIAALQLIESLQPPLLLGFSRVVQEKTSIDIQMENMNQANHYHPETGLNQETHVGDHLDIAVEGTHHQHDSGTYNHHTTNTFKIMRADYGTLQPLH